MSTQTTRFAVIRTASHNGSFRNAVDGVQVPTPEGMTYFVRRIATSKSRSMYGITEVTVYGVIDGEPTINHKPLTWATREAAEAVAAKHTTAYTTYGVLALDVVEEFSTYAANSEEIARATARNTPCSWVEIKGARTLVLRAPVSTNA